jgi:hypothetical protein
MGKTYDTSRVRVPLPAEKNSNILLKLSVL